MIEIYLKGGVFYKANINIDTMHELIVDDFIKEFIPLTLADGFNAYIKKSEIVSFNETDESDEYIES